MIPVIKSDEVRNSFRDVLDTVQNGSTTIIERDKKSIGVIVPIEQWQSCQRILEAITEAKAAKALRLQGESKLTSADEMKRLMHAKQAGYVGD